ncbi:phage holin, LLH family [Paenibacillus sp. NPDC057934]|uniref:phage holin, LLH family n=1 Tax=Paenibacillus sp. NPDC057934 TaxID=3346282 RepID=UPI0036DC8DA8
MQSIIDGVQPYVTNIVLAVVGVLATVILRTVALLQQKANSWFDARLSVSQRELLHKVAAEAFAYAETVYKDKQNQVKLAQALEYATQQLGCRGIKIKPIEIRAAIEKAWYEYEGKDKKNTLR